MPTVRIQEKNYSESIMVLKLKDGEFDAAQFGRKVEEVYGYAIDSLKEKERAMHSAVRSA